MGRVEALPARAAPEVCFGFRVPVHFSQDLEQPLGMPLSERCPHKRTDAAGRPTIQGKN